MSLSFFVLFCFQAFILNFIDIIIQSSCRFYTDVVVESATGTCSSGIIKGKLVILGSSLSVTRVSAYINFNYRELF